MQFLFFVQSLFSASRELHIHVKGESTFGEPTLLVTFKTKVSAQCNCLEVFSNNCCCHSVYAFLNLRNTSSKMLVGEVF